MEIIRPSNFDGSLEIMQIPRSERLETSFGNSKLEQAKQTS